MSKRFGRSLDSVIAGTDAATVATGEDMPHEAEPVAAISAPSPEPQPSTLERTAGVVPLTIHVTPADRRRLRQLSLDADMSLQQLGIRAWSLLLESRGLPALTPTKANVPDGRKRRTGGEGERG